MPWPLARSSIACSTSACADSTRMAACGNSARIMRAAGKALGRVVWRHPDIDDYQVGFALAHQLDKVGGIACLADDMEAGLLEQARDPLTEEDVIVGQDYARLRHVTMIPPLACGGR